MVFKLLNTSLDVYNYVHILHLYTMKLIHTHIMYNTLHINLIIEQMCVLVHEINFVSFCNKGISLYFMSIFSKEKYFKSRIKIDYYNSISTIVCQKQFVNYIKI